MSAASRPGGLGLFLIAALGLGWGLNWLALRAALLEVPPWTFRALTTAFAGGFLLAGAWLSGTAVRPQRREAWSLAIAALFNVTLWHMTVAFGVVMMGVGRAAILAFTMPLWATMLALAFLGERPTGRAWVAIACGLAGIAALLSRDSAAIGESPAGVALMLAAAVTWAIGTILQKRMAWTLPPVPMAGWQMLFGAAPILVVALVLEWGWRGPVSATAWVAIAYTTLVALLFSYYAWFRLIEILPANIASISTLLAPVIAVASGAAVLAEPFGWQEGLALALILIGLALVLVLPPVPRAAAPARR